MQQLVAYHCPPLVHAFASIAEEIVQDVYTVLRWISKRVYAFRSAWRVYFLRQKLFRPPTPDDVVYRSKQQWASLVTQVNYYRSEEGRYQLLLRSARPLAMLCALTPLIIVLAIRRATQNDDDSGHKPLLGQLWKSPTIRRAPQLPQLKRMALEVR